MKRHDERLRRRRRRLARRRRERRGVLLLVVLSLLTLFLLLGTTFLVTGNQYRTASAVVEKANRTTFQPADLLDRALMELLRDTNNRSSVIRYHSLLRDLYGVDGFVARAQVTPPTGFANQQDFTPRFAGATTASPLGPTNGQVVEFYVFDDDSRSVLEELDFNAVGLDFDQNGLPVPHTLSQTNGYYEGCLLTFMTGPCRGSTVRVLDYQHEGTHPYRYTGASAIQSNAGVARIRIVAPRRADGARLTVGGGSGLTIQELVADASLGHRFLVNGRPLNGAGVGYNALALSSGVLNRPLARLSAIEAFSFSPPGSNDDNYGLEIALTPNSVHFNQSRTAHLKPNRFIDPWQEGLMNTPGNPATSDYEYLNYLNDLSGPRATPLYGGFAGPGDTDESYDAPDYQNMALASQALEPRARGRMVTPDGPLDPEAYYAAGRSDVSHLDLEGVAIPSFHRPALVNFWFHRLINSEWLSNLVSDPGERVRAVLEPYNANGQPQHGLNAQAAQQIASLKRKFLLRPLREDHPDFDGGNVLARYGTDVMRNALQSGNMVNAAGEIAFPYWEAVGPWDVDNDGDGIPDSVWVDIGLPVQQTEDGRWYKPLVAMLVEDLDGRLNLNAHGGPDDLLLIDNLDRSTPGSVARPFGNLARDLKRDPSAASSAVNALTSSGQLASGEGWGPADTSLRPVMSPTLPLDNWLNDVNGGSAPPRPNGGLPSYTGHAQYDDYARLLCGRPAPSEAGRLAASAIDVSEPFGRYGSGGATIQGVLLCEPGKTANYSRGIFFREPTRDERTPFDFMGYPLADNRTSTGFFASPPDLRSRWAGAGDLAGGAVTEFRNESAGSLTATPNDSPYELNLSSARRRLEPASLDAIRQSYQLSGGTFQNVPIVDDAPFSPAEIERVLRANDGDADKLAGRLWDLVDGFHASKLAAQRDVNSTIRDGGAHPLSNASYTPSSLDSAAAQSQAAINRRLVTTESWDLPAPNENWTDRLILGADGLPGVPWTDADNDGIPKGQDDNDPSDGDGDFGDDDSDGLYDEGDEAIVAYDASRNADYDALFTNGNCDDYVVVMRATPPSPARITDYLRYRVVLELKRGGVFAANVVHTEPTLSLAVNRVLYGDNTLDASSLLRFQQPFTFGGMLAPEVLAGRRMNLNRPLGDGRDNNGNSVVDEPDEAGEPFVDANGDGTVANTSARREFFDLDNNGVWAGEDPAVADGVYYRDADNDGGLDGFDPRDTDQNNDGVADIADVDRDGFVEGPRTDFFWNDANHDGVPQLAEVRPFDHTPGVDANGRGATVGGASGARVYDDQQMARQLYARHLYCLMLALADENYLAPYDPEDPQVLSYIDPLSGQFFRGPTPESSVAFKIASELFGGNHTVRLTNPADEARRTAALRQARRIAMRKLTCRNLAQWCVNVVDFRDPDAIQTPFEYDENPWDGWNVVDTAGTPDNRTDDGVYPLDGDLTTDENLHMVRRITGSGIGDPERIDRNGAAITDPTRRMRTLDQTRGVVWGAERPEVLLTEGLAWHDRRLEDLDGKAAEGSDEVGDGGTTQEEDDDLDQARKPKGNVFLELYNPSIDGAHRPAELYSYVGRDGVVVPQDGVRLDRLSNAPADRTRPLITRSPVWRIACVEEHPLIRNSTFVKGNRSFAGDPQVAASDDPYQPNLYEEYLNVGINQGPWLYSVSGGAAQNAATGGVPQPPMTAADESFWNRKRIEALAAYATRPNVATGQMSTDVDGVWVPQGVLEVGPTMPDTSFPTFNRTRQPQRTGLIQNLPISSRVDGQIRPQQKERVGQDNLDIHEINRAVAVKPDRFIERAFYMAPAQAVEVQSTISGQRNALFGDLTLPGYRIPLLVYDLPVDVRQARARINQELRQVGVEVLGANNAVRVHASKFAAGIDRTDYDDDNDRRETISFAPVLPGHRAIVGTAGEIVIDLGVDAGTPIDMFGDDAARLTNRYVTIVSHPLSPLNLGPDPNLYRDLRRFEMTPGYRGFDPAQYDPINPNTASLVNPPIVNQFGVRMNGGPELLSVTRPGGAVSGTNTPSFNVTVGEAQATNNPAVGAGPPVVAIPIDAMSISEPLDQYLIRQLELDPQLEHYVVVPALSPQNRDSRPVETYFADAQRDVLHFDEPFDLLPELIENQTTPNYRSMHLERLANPLMPWNPEPYRPDGEPEPQHVATLPVNPYLPVDAHPLDLTAFNGLTDPLRENEVSEPPASTKHVHIPANGANDFGPEQRHRRPRGLPQLGQMETALGFLSGERIDAVGPFAAFWAIQPLRLLWRQATPTTTTAWSHNDANNNFRALSNDRLKRQLETNGGAPWEAGGSPPATNRQRVQYDELLVDSNDPARKPTFKELNVDYPWRMTLGFADRFWGEFFTGSELEWARDNDTERGLEVSVANAQTINTGSGSLLGAPEINDTEVVTQDPLLASGYPTAPDGLEDNATTPRLHWPNRPFASAGELLQVPAWGGSRILTRYSVFDWLYTNRPGFEHRRQVNPYDGESRVTHDGLDYTPNAPRVSSISFDGDYTNDGSDADNVGLSGVADVGGTNRIRWRETLGHFGHLLNFFQTARFPAYGDTGQEKVILNGSSVNVPSFVARGAAHHYRLLDYVCVPSQFTATDARLNNDVFAAASVPATDPRAELAAPFNTVDDQREPGRVNLNTMVGRRDALEPADSWSEAYDGLMRRYQDGSLIADLSNNNATDNDVDALSGHDLDNEDNDSTVDQLIQTGRLGPAWRDVALSRRGYVQPDFDPTTPNPAIDYSPSRLHPNFPTLFANPFRAPGEGANVPLVHMVQTGVDATVLRSHPLSPGADGAWGIRGRDERTVNKTEGSTGDTLPDRNGLRDDAGEAGFYDNAPGVMQITGANQNAVQRLSVDVVLARFVGAASPTRRGALQDTFIEDAFRVRITDPNMRDPNLPTAPLRNNRPNYEISHRTTPTPLFSGAALDPSLDTERNPSHRYAPLQQMAGQATTRSGVYAVWITVGFFEVTPAREDQRVWPRYMTDDNNDQIGDTLNAGQEELFNRVYPDGWMLGRELDADTGQNLRHRGFYIVDRTRPVAFRPGEDANTDQTVLLRRRIE